MMYSITCDCGKKVESEDPHMTEAMILRHALTDHKDMLHSMTVEQLAGETKSHHDALGMHAGH